MPVLEEKHFDQAEVFKQSIKNLSIGGNPVANPYSPNQYYIHKLEKNRMVIGYQFTDNKRKRCTMTILPDNKLLAHHHSGFNIEPMKRALGDRLVSTAGLRIESGVGRYGNIAQRTIKPNLLAPNGYTIQSSSLSMGMVVRLVGYDGHEERFGHRLPEYMLFDNYMILSPSTCLDFLLQALVRMLSSTSHAIAYIEIKKRSTGCKLKMGEATREFSTTELNDYSGLASTVNGMIQSETNRAIQERSNLYSYNSTSLSSYI